MLERVWREGNPPTLLMGIYFGSANVENTMEISLKTTNKTTIPPNNPTTGHVP